MDKKQKNDITKNSMPIVDNNPKPYRYGIGINLIDENIINGPDVQRAVNRETLVPGDEKADDRITE